MSEPTPEDAKRCYDLAVQLEDATGRPLHASEIGEAILAAEQRGEERAALEIMTRAKANWAAIGGLPDEWKKDVEKYCDRIERLARLAGWEAAREACDNLLDAMEQGCLGMAAQGTSCAEHMASVLTNARRRIAALTPPDLALTPASTTDGAAKGAGE